jgi:very-short-patch-repair endonuclease
MTKIPKNLNEYNTKISKKVVKLVKKYTMPEIAALLNVPYDKIFYICDFLNLKTIYGLCNTPAIKAKEQWFKKNKLLIMRENRRGLSCSEISNKHNFTYHQTYQAHKRLKLKMVKQGTSITTKNKVLSKKYRILKKELKFLYVEEEQTIKTIRGIFDCTHQSVLEELERHGIRQRTISEDSEITWRSERMREGARKNCNDGISGIRKLSKNKTNGKYWNTSLEKIFKKSCRKFGVRYKQSYQIQKGGHFYDFFLPQYNVLIECDGEYWHNNDKQRIRDKRHNKEARILKFEIKRFFGNDLKRGKHEKYIKRLVARRTN